MKDKKRSSVKAQTATIIERKLGRERAWGLAYQGDNLIEIDPRQDPKNYLDTLIHEMLHLIHPEWTEEEVMRTASGLAEAVWAANYRKVAN